MKCDGQSKAEALTVFAEKFIKDVCLNADTRKKWCIIAGPCGTGKSHVAKCLSRFFKSSAIDLYVEGPWRLGDEIPKGYYRDWKMLTTRNDFDFDQALYDIDSAAFVVLDDVGSETDRFKSGLPTERLLRALDARQDKFLLLTTNAPLAQWPKAFDARVASRLSAASYFDTTGIPDYRPRLAGK